MTTIDWQTLRLKLAAMRLRAQVSPEELARRITTAGKRTNKTTIYRVENVKKRPDHKPDLQTIELWLRHTSGMTLSAFFGVLETAVPPTDEAPIDLSDSDEAMRAFGFLDSEQQNSGRQDLGRERSRSSSLKSPQPLSDDKPSQKEGLDDRAVPPPAVLVTPDQLLELGRIIGRAIRDATRDRSAANARPGKPKRRPRGARTA